MNTSLLDNPYLIDILGQPQALRATADGFAVLDDRELRDFAKRLSTGTLKRVVLTGMGSSFHALHPLRLRLIAAGIHTAMVETAELVHFAPALISPESLVVIVSQSGRSAEVVQLLDLAQGQAPCIAVTNTPGSPLAERCDALLLTCAGDEFSVSCKTYLAALAGLALLGNVLTGENPTEALAACRAAAGAVEGYLAHWEKYTETARQAFSGVRDLILVGRGPSLAAVGTGGLIIKEAAHFHSEGMSSAAFRHGPFEMTSPDLFVMVYAGAGPARQLNENLVADVLTAGGRAALISSRADEGAFNLPVVPAGLYPFVEILPAQIASLALAEINQHTPGRFERGSKVTVVA